MPEPLPFDEHLAQEFYDWEVLGRGWQLWENPVALEPAYRPFIRHPPVPYPGDDGRDHTLFSGIIDGLRRLFAGRSPAPPEAEDSLIEPRKFNEVVPMAELELVPPRDFDPSSPIMQQFLASLEFSSYPIAFEMIGTADRIVTQFAAAQGDLSRLKLQTQAHFPDVAVTEHNDLLAQTWSDAGEYALVVEFGLSREFMIPLTCPRNFNPDPLIGIAGALPDLEYAETGLLQVLFEPTRKPWAASMLRAVTFNDGSEFFDSPVSVLDRTKDKLSRPLYAAVIRIAVKTAEEERAWEIAQNLAGILTGLGGGTGNELIPLENSEYDHDQHAQDICHRQSRRSGMILNTDELTALVHVPSSAVRTPKLTRQIKRTKSLPSVAMGRDCTLGENLHAGRKAEVGLSAEQRSRHTYVIGASGTGKSQLLLSMIVQDMERGRGLALLDPHGDLIDEVLARVPDRRIDDVILLDPSDEEYTVSFNILSAKTEIEKTVLASDLVSVFQRLSTSWGDQMTSVLGNAILAFLERPQGGTLADLRRFLIESSYRNEVLATVTDPEVIYYWKKHFPLIRGTPLGSVLTRLDTFLRRKPIRQMVCLKEKALDFAAIMNGGKIFLARIPQGLIGEENAHLLGTLLVSKFHQLAMARQQDDAAKRKDFYLYIDEFHHFVTPSMSSILSEARKYRLGLILAHQELRQLDSRGVDLSSAVLSNPYSRICFRVGDQDAKRLAEGFSFFTAADLQNLGTGEALCRIERSDFDFNLSTRLLPAIEESAAEQNRARVVAKSREQHAIRRASISEETIVVEDSLSPVEIAPPPEPALIETKPDVPLTPSSPAKPSRKSPIAHDEPPMLGRGGPDHQYLQQLIKQWAQGMGYRATIEAPLPGGGSVDVALEKGNRRIACETSVTNTPAYEVGNIQKSLNANYQYVVLVTTEIKHRTRIETAAREALTPAELAHVRFFSPDELFTFVQELEVNDAKQEQLVCGYKVKTSVRSTDAQDQAMRQQAIAEVVARSVTRLRKRR